MNCFVNWQFGHSFHPFDNLRALHRVYCLDLIQRTKRSVREEIRQRQMLAGNVVVISQKPFQQIVRFSNFGNVIRRQRVNSVTFDRPETSF